MKAYRKFAAIAAVLAAGGTAHAQATDTELPPGIAPTAAQQAAATDPAAAESNAGVVAPTGWPLLRGEKHLMLRALAGGAIRFGDPWGQGAMAPPWMLVQGSFLFGVAGPVRIGLSVGGQLGFDLGKSGVQYALQPGLIAMIRPTASLGLTIRADVPILFTRGANEYATLPSSQIQMPGEQMSPLRYPEVRPIVATPGIEVGIGGTYFLTAGFGIVLEVNGGVYFGDSSLTYPLLGVGLGLLFDYEILP